MRVRERLLQLRGFVRALLQLPLCLVQLRASDADAVEAPDELIALALEVGHALAVELNQLGAGVKRAKLLALLLGRRAPRTGGVGLRRANLGLGHRGAGVRESREPSPTACRDAVPTRRAPVASTRARLFSRRDEVRASHAATRVAPREGRWARTVRRANGSEKRLFNGHATRNEKMANVFFRSPRGARGHTPRHRLEMPREERGGFP